MIEVKGQGNNIARLIKHSISPSGVQFFTWELEYWRGFHSENMTHRMLSKNASSTRAIKIESAIDNIRKNTGMPIHWGTNNAGMQSKNEMSVDQQEQAKKLWLDSMESVIGFVEKLSDKSTMNGHKQWVGRLLEPYSCIKVVESGTEFANYEALRYHPDAQPEFKDLLHCMITAKQMSTPELLLPGEWHTPYVTTKRINGVLTYWSNEETQIDSETALKISASCCAQVSYRRLDDTIDKALAIFDKLNLHSKQNPAHASPVEHQASPMTDSNCAFDPSTWESGVTHVRKDGSLWSGNLRGWVQYRQLFENQAVW